MQVIRKQAFVFNKISSTLDAINIFSMLMSYMFRTEIIIPSNCCVFRLLSACFWFINCLSETILAILFVTLWHLEPAGRCVRESVCICVFVTRKVSHLDAAYKVSVLSVSHRCVTRKRAKAYHPTPSPYTQTHIHTGHWRS